MTIRRSILDFDLEQYDASLLLQMDPAIYVHCLKVARRLNELANEIEQQNDDAFSSGVTFAYRRLADLMRRGEFLPSPWGTEAPGD